MSWLEKILPSIGKNVKKNIPEELHETLDTLIKLNKELQELDTKDTTKISEFAKALSVLNTFTKNQKVAHQTLLMPSLSG